jgi:hypothetical protein
MKEMKHILSLLICLLVLTSNYQLVRANELKVETKKECKDSSKEKDQSSTEISTASLEAVIPVPDIQFGHDFTFEPSLTYVEPITFTRISSNRVLNDSFFKKLYASSILINAP